MPEYLESPGWTGNAVWQAGGSCYLGSYFDDYYGETCYGYISTKEMALYGDLKISFRAKRAANAPEDTYLWLAICDNYYGPVDNGNKEFYLTTEWQDFVFESDAATFNDYNIVQFAAYEGEMLIDDIVISRANNKIAAPSGNPVVNNSTTSFTASWTEVTDADDYLLSVYYMDYPEIYIPEGTIMEGFDGINATDGLIDTENPGYPEGWTIDLSTNKDATDNIDITTADGTFSSGKQAIVLGEVDDYIMTPVMPAPLSKISFWCRPSSMEYEDYQSLSMIGIDVLVDGEWQRMANMPNYYFEENGGVWSLEVPNLSANATQLKISYIQKGIVKFFIDDVTCVYETQRIPYELFTDKVVDGTSYTVENYDNQYEHYYYVKARNSVAISDASYPIWVDGLNGIKPVTKPATNVAHGAFTANWENLPNADNYKVNLIKVANGTGEDVVLLHETFDKVTEGTVDAPITSWNTTESLVEKGYTDADWMLQLPAYASGMVGAQSAYWVTAGLVVSPRVTLDADNGTFKVAFKAYMVDATDVLWLLVIKEHTDTQALLGAQIEFPNSEPGLFEGEYLITKNIDGGENLKFDNIKLAFMSQNGMPFYIDEVTVTQKYAVGEQALIPYRTVFTDKASYTFEELDEAPAYAYNVKASAVKDYYEYATQESDLMFVEMSTVSVEDIEQGATTAIASFGGNIVVNTNCATNVEVYNLQGMKVASVQAAVGLTQIPCQEYTGQTLIVKAGSKTTKLVVK